MKIYELELQVRDYECDVQGIVNNAIYQNYFEHTRHEFLNSIGCDFNKLRSEGVGSGSSTQKLSTWRHYVPVIVFYPLSLFRELAVLDYYSSKN